MALARSCLNSRSLLTRRSPLLFNTAWRVTGTQRFDVAPSPSYCRCFSSSTAAAAASTTSGDGSNSAVSADKVSSSLTSSSTRGRGRRGLLWRDPRDLVPFRNLNNTGLGFLGNTLMQVSENLNKLVENWAPSRLLGRMKEDDKRYRLRFEVPGLSKEDLRITVEDGFLVINGEHKEEEEEGSSSSDDDYWYSQRYGYYNTSLLLPEDAKIEDIKAEVKDGVLYVTIPRSGDKIKKNVKEVEIH